MNKQDLTETLDRLEYEDVKHRHERGDFSDPAEIKVVERWLKARLKEQKHMDACVQAAKSAAYDATKLARRSNYYALLAIALSLIAAQDQIVGFVSHLAAAFGP